LARNIQQNYAFGKDLPQVSSAEALGCIRKQGLQRTSRDKHPVLPVMRTSVNLLFMADYNGKSGSTAYLRVTEQSALCVPYPLVPGNAGSLSWRTNGMEVIKFVPAETFDADH